MEDPELAPSLRIEIKNRAPVELASLTEMLDGLGDEYRRFLHTHPGAPASELKLYVRKIESGSIIAEVVAMAPALLPFVEHANTVIDFGTHLRVGLNYLLGKIPERPDLNSQGLKNLAKIVEPIVGDRGAQINFGIVEKGAQITVIQKINSVEADAVQNASRREVELLREPVARIHEKVLFYWYQARADVSAQKGDMGIIENISQTPVKVEFTDGAAKSDMLSGKKALHRAYIVDVQVGTIQGRPRLYTIVNYHGPLHDEEEYEE